MPRATANQETRREDLKTLEGGFVEIRRLSFGERLAVRSMLAKMKMGNAEGKAKDVSIEAAMDHGAVQFFKFANAIVDHNLEDHLGRKLNLKSRKDFDSLDESVGYEIENLIDQIDPDVEAELDTAPVDGSDPLESGSSTQLSQES